MLTEYLQAAMRHAKYEILEDDGTFYGSIPECQGVWANAPTLEECREELREVLEGWVLLGIAHGHDLPVIDGISLEVKVA
jgi:predicted RNase H-like HicB family nuclease